MIRTVLLVVAKAPEAGKAKTRLSPPADSRQAAEIAAAGLLDTLRAVRRVPHAEPVVAWTGDLDRAERRDEVAEALAGTRMIEQRGDDFGARLAAAHGDVAELYPGSPVLQIGMDTPQVSPDLLVSSAAGLYRQDGPDAVLGPAVDGGWWALGLRDPAAAAALAQVPMSRPDTGTLTRHALQQGGLRVAELVELADVDTMETALDVARRIPDSEFAAAVRVGSEAVR